MLERKLGPKAPVDVKALSLEGMEKREERWFEVERDITQENREKIKERLARSRIQGAWGSFVGLASEMYLLGMEPEITINDKQKMKEALANHQSRKRWWNFARLASDMRLFGIEPELTSDDEVKIEETLVNYRNTEDWYNLALIASDMRRLNIETKITQEDIKKIRETITRYQGGWWMNSLRLASTMRILGIEPEITPQDKENVKKGFIQDGESGYWGTFASIASYMRSLSADEIKVGGPKGLEIIDYAKKPRLAKETPSLPDQRNF
ncbi:MAG: hypothetical protein Q8P27_03615 [Candidatus Peregrinibacteria bacterium]|nr:hypothetical protein [Candidatus Peregrinibacteria bacterium]